jgi:hypothetical protein
LIFEVAVILLALLWALSLWFFLNYSKRQRELAAQQAVLRAERDDGVRHRVSRQDQKRTLGR